MFNCMGVSISQLVGVSVFQISTLEEDYRGGTQLGDQAQGW